jgi:hypothetical protein
MNLQNLIKEKREKILETATRHGASNVRVFGSVARGEADEKSDIDILVSFEPERSLFDHAALLIELEALLGCKVDVVSDKGLRPRVREHILLDAVEL